MAPTRGHLVVPSRSILPARTERESSEVRIGALCWDQYTEWPALLETGKRADALGYDTLWTWDQTEPARKTRGHS